MNKTVFLALALIAGSASALPTATAAECDAANFDEIQECEQWAEEEIQDGLGLVGRTAQFVIDEASKAPETILGIYCDFVGTC